jgi:hypothetical protein
MKKLVIMMLTVSGSVFSLNAELKRDETTCRYSSIPATSGINQNEYHQLVWSCKDILSNYAQQQRSLLARYPGAYRSSSYDPENKAGQAAVSQYLQRIATITSLRLLSDLKNINFAI